LALGLRPSMLDDFGLQAALEWLARDFMARSGTNVDLAIDGDFDSLPDKYRTCMYRIVQEAMTNCARHADARHIHIGVNREGDQLQVSIADDGIGVDPGHLGRGLGLRGIEERVKELQGTLTISRGPRRGTTLIARLPLPVDTEVPLARAAG
jgi:signal transduction histidine kinase